MAPQLAAPPLHASAPLPAAPPPPPWQSVDFIAKQSAVRSAASGSCLLRLFYVDKRLLQSAFRWDKCKGLATIRACAAARSGLQHAGAGGSHPMQIELMKVLHKTTAPSFKDAMRHVSVLQSQTCSVRRSGSSAGRNSRQSTKPSSFSSASAISARTSLPPANKAPRLTCPQNPVKHGCTAQMLPP